MLSRILFTILSFCMLVMPVAVQAQNHHASFEIIKRHPNYKGYRYFDECTSAIMRMTTRTDPADSIFLDTMKFDPSRWPRTDKDSVIKIGLSCMRPDLLTSLEKEFAFSYATTLLRIGMEDEAVNLVTTLLDSLPYKEAVNSVVDAIVRAGGSSSRVITLMPSRPFNVSFYKRIVDHVVSKVPADSIYLSSLAKFTLWKAIAPFNDPDSNRLRGEWSKIDSGILESNLPGMEVEIIKALTRCRHDLVRVDEEEIDSIKVSTAALKSLVEFACSDMNMYVGRPDQADAGITGKAVPSVLGEYWFSGNNIPPFSPKLDKSLSFVSATGLSRPVPGKINLIVKFNNECHSQSPGVRRPIPPLRRCNEAATSIRRILMAHPDVELTIVSQTRGFLGLFVEQDPAEEAELLAEYIFGHYRLPGVLAVVKTPYFRVAASDKRRVDNTSAWEEEERDLGVRGFNTAVFLIDQEGLGVMDGFISPLDEIKWIKRIEALKKRK